MVFLKQFDFQLIRLQKTKTFFFDKLIFFELLLLITIALSCGNLPCLYHSTNVQVNFLHSPMTFYHVHFVTSKTIHPASVLVFDW